MLFRVPEAERGLHDTKEALDETSEKNFLTVKVLKHKARCWGYFWRLLRTCLSNMHEEWQTADPAFRIGVD